MLVRLLEEILGMTKFNLNKFHFDVDGVMKRLDIIALGYEPDTWRHKRYGLTVIDIVNQDPTIVYFAHPSEYLDIINTLYYKNTINIITSQRPSWISCNERWLTKHLQCAFNVQYTNNPEEKLSLLGDNDILVEDSPLFPDYDKIILIDRKYNRHINVPTRVHNPGELLMEIIKRL